MKPLLWRRAIRDSELDGAAKLVAFTLSVYMNGAGECWPSKAALAEDTGLSERTVDRAILRLEGAGYLLVERRGGRHKTNRYATRNPVTSDPLSRLGNPVTGDAFSDEKPRQGERETPSLATENPVTGDPRSSKEVVQEVGTASRPETAEQRRARAALIRQSSSLLRDVDEPRARAESDWAAVDEERPARHFVPFDECSDCGHFLELADLALRLCASCAAQVAA